MRQHVPDINLASIIMHGSDQSNLVAADIEDSEPCHLISLRKSLTQLREVRKASFSHDRVPVRKRGSSVQMLLCELIQTLPCDDMHSYQEVKERPLDRKALSKRLKR